MPVVHAFITAAVQHYLPDVHVALHRLAVVPAVPGSVTVPAIVDHFAPAIEDVETIAPIIEAVEDGQEVLVQAVLVGREGVGRVDVRIARGDHRLAQGIRAAEGIDGH